MKKKMLAAICFVLALVLFLGGLDTARSAKRAEGNKMEIQTGHSGEVIDSWYIGRDEDVMKLDSYLSMFLYVCATVMGIMGVIYFLSPDTMRVYGKIIQREDPYVMLRMDNGLQNRYKCSNQVRVSVGDSGFALINGDRLMSFEKR